MLSMVLLPTICRTISYGEGTVWRGVTGYEIVETWSHAQSLARADRARGSVPWMPMSNTHPWDKAQLHAFMYLNHVILLTCTNELASSVSFLNN